FLFFPSPFFVLVLIIFVVPFFVVLIEQVVVFVLVPGFFVLVLVPIFLVVIPVIVFNKQFKFDVHMKSPWSNNLSETIHPDMEKSREFRGPEHGANTFE